MKRKRDPKGTKKAILEAAFEEMYLNGYQGASIASILNRTGMTKGALFHHFPNKLALGYAVLEKIVEPMIVDTWLAPLAGCENPIDTLQDMLRSAVKRMTDRQMGKKALLLGCPLNHFAQEMSPLDQGFKERVNRIFNRWQSEMAAALMEGQRNGKVKADVDVENTAMFVISSLEGAIGMGKRTQSLAQCLEILNGCGEHLSQYLESLRP